MHGFFEMRRGRSISCGDHNEAVGEHRACEICGRPVVHGVGDQVAASQTAVVSLSMALTKAV